MKSLKWLANLDYQTLETVRHFHTSNVSSARPTGATVISHSVTHIILICI